MVRTMTRRSANRRVPDQPVSPPRVTRSKRNDSAAVEPCTDSSNPNNSYETVNGSTVKETGATENVCVENQITESSEENCEKDTSSTVEDATEGEREGKGKSKSNNKTDLENSSLLNENTQQTNSHISETVQVTAQSPSKDNPVDYENGNTVVSDASNSVSNNVETLNPEDATPAESTNDDKTADVSQPGDVVESEQNDSSIQESGNESTACENSDSPLNNENDMKTNRSVSVDASLSKEGKKIRLRRNTVQGTETAKVIPQSTASHENGKSENENVVPENEAPQPKLKKASVKIRLNRDRCKQQHLPNDEHSTDNTTDGESANTSIEEKNLNKPPSRPTQWGGVYQYKAGVPKVDIEVLKTLYRKVKVLDENDVKLDLPKERVKTSSESEKKIERKICIEFAAEESDRPEYKKQISSNSSGDEAKEEKNNIIAFNRKISIVHDTASKLRPPPEPAKNPVSDVLFITNLVRPFTVKQLKELLERTGKIVEGGFWTDRIKSKCYVRYENKEEAEDTRNALHGVNWPIGNGKKLMIEYSTLEEMEKVQNPPSTTPPHAEFPKDKIVKEKENKDPVKQRRLSEDAVKDSAKDNTKRRDGRVREWDIGKEDLHRRRSRSRSKDKTRRSRSRGKDKDGNRSRERHSSKDKDKSHKNKRTPSPVAAALSKKIKKAEEEIAQKLMDDLFLKTKATPSIYWQPLSPEEIATKQQQRLLRMEEHKRRMEVSSRTRGGRDSGRGVSYRRR